MGMGAGARAGPVRMHGRLGAGSRQALRAIRRQPLVDPGRAAADQRAVHRPGSRRVYLGGYPERVGSVRRRSLHHLHPRQPAAVAGHLDPRADARSQRQTVDRLLQGPVDVLRGPVHGDSSGRQVSAPDAGRLCHRTGRQRRHPRGNRRRRDARRERQAGDDSWKPGETRAFAPAAQRRPVGGQLRHGVPDRVGPDDEPALPGERGRRRGDPAGRSPGPDLGGDVTGAVLSRRRRMDSVRRSGAVDFADRRPVRGPRPEPVGRRQPLAGAHPRLAA